MIWSPSPDSKVKGTAGVNLRTSGVRHENLEDICAGIDSLADTDQDYVKGSVVEEDDPLAEFEAWLASGAVEIVDKL